MYNPKKPFHNNYCVIFFPQKPYRVTSETWTGKFQDIGSM